MAEFETGAVRSSDADRVAYNLISPIGLERLSLVSFSNNSTEELIEQAIAEIYTYLRGDRSYDHLADASWYLMIEAEIQERGLEETKRFLEITKGYYTRIPRVGLRRLAETYKEGALNYAPFNCEKGFPVYDLLNHALKHIFDYLDQRKMEDDLGHAIWNLVMSMHSEELWPHLNEGFTRGPNCSLTEKMIEEIDRTMARRNRAKALEIAKREKFSYLSAMIEGNFTNEQIVHSMEESLKSYPGDEHFLEVKKLLGG